MEAAMLRSSAFIFLCLAALVTALAVPLQTKKNEETNEIPQTDDVHTSESVVPVAVMTTSEAPPTTLTVAAASESTDAISSTTSSTTERTTVGKQPQLSSGFIRLIDDIFQIPISVLKAVNTLLSNPFRPKTSTQN